MRLRQGESILSEAIRDSLAALGYTQRLRLSFTRERVGCTHILNFGGRVEKGVFKFTFSVGIRFLEVEAILRPENDDPTYPTIVMPIHFLHEDRKYFEWDVSGAPGAARMAQEVMSEVSGRAQAFFDRYATLSAVDESLASANALDWFVLTADQHVGVRAAIAKVEGREDDAKAIVDEALADPRNANPRKRWRIEELRSRLGE